MKKLIFILLILIPVLSFGQSRTIRGDLIVKGRFTELPYGTINMADYYRSDADISSYNYRSGILSLSLHDGEFNYFQNINDTINITFPTNKSFVVDQRTRFINTASDIEMDNLRTTIYSESNYFNHYVNTRSNGLLNNIRFSSNLYPEDEDTISIDRWHGVAINNQTYTPFSSSRVDILDERILSLYGSFDNYMVVDSVQAIHIDLRNDGIPADSISAVYGIYNLDDGLRGADRTYFLYSEYGDIFSAGNYDQYGFVTKLGADHGSWTARTDDIVKSTVINMPHYDIDEEDINIVGGIMGATDNNLNIGGGNGVFNAVTDTRIFAAADRTTLTGTQVGQFDVNGFEITSGRFKQPTISYSLTDGAPLDAEIDAATGTTPADAGAGASYIIIDSDGSGLTYKVMSDGTNWVYWTATIAL